jgi:hypothetical protein
MDLCIFTEQNKNNIEKFECKKTSTLPYIKSISSVITKKELHVQFSIRYCNVDYSFTNGCVGPNYGSAILENGKKSWKISNP